MPDEPEPVDDAQGEEIQLEDGAVDVSQSESQSQEEAMVSSISETMTSTPLGPPKPKSNIFTLLLVISLLFIIVAIYLVAHELNGFYEVTFGGILSPPVKVAETAGPEPGK